VTPNVENAMVVWRWPIVPKFACGKIVVAVGGRVVALVAVTLSKKKL